MARIADSGNGTATGTPLHGALAVGSRIGELTVIENIVKVKALDAAAETVELGTTHGIGVVFLAQEYAADAIIVARLAIEQIYSYLVAVQAEVEILFVFAPKMGEVDGVAQKNPAPPEVRPYLVRGFRGKYKFLTFCIAKMINLVSVGVLKHQREIVVLRFYIAGVYPGELFHKLIDAVQERGAQLVMGRRQAIDTEGTDN